MDNEISEILWAEVGSRARKVVKRSNYRVTGKCPSWKMGRMMHWESKIERDAFYLFDAAPEVKMFSEQPAEIRFIMNGKKRKHFPDILVETLDKKKFLYEIKSKQESEDDDLKLRTAYLTSALNDFGIHYLLITDEQIRREPRLTNIRMFLRYGFKSVSFEKQQSLIKKYFANQTCRWGNIVNDDGNRGNLSTLSRMILENVVLINPNESINNDTTLELNLKIVSQPWL